METMTALPYQGLIDFFRYFFSGLVYLLLFCLIYLRVTPYDELEMIRQGKLAPAISLGGAIIGFVLPLHSAISHSISFTDMLIWALVAMVVQIALFLLVRLFMKGVVRQISDNQPAAATLLAFISVAIGLLNAASMSY